MNTSFTVNAVGQFEDVTCPDGYSCTYQNAEYSLCTSSACSLTSVLQKSKICSAQHEVLCRLAKPIDRPPEHEPGPCAEHSKRAGWTLKSWWQCPGTWPGAVRLHRTW